MKHNSINRTQRGSALLVAMLLAIAISVIVGVYFKMAIGELKLADSGFIYNSLLNLTEKGAEDAAWALNNCEEDVDWTADGWTKKTIGIIDYMSRKITGVDLGNGKTGTIYIVVKDYAEEEPIIYAEAQGQLPSGRIVSKQLMIELSGRSLVAAGLIAKDLLTLSGDINMDSYNSSDGPWNATTNRNADITVGSISSSINTVNVTNANIWGVLGTGGQPPNVNAFNATVKGPDTPDGVNVDPDRISTSLSAQFEQPVSPDTASFITDIPGGNSIVGNVPIGIAGGSLEEYFLISDLTIPGSSILLIDGPVVIVMDTGRSVDISGKIHLTCNGSLTIYLDGNVTASGSGIVNESAIPENLIIYGTSIIAGGQSISLSGSSALHAVVYTPNANVSISGGSSTHGAVVANQINMSGNSTFHYDEALSDFFGGSDTFEMDNWLELSDIADRIDLTSYFP